MNHRHSIKVGMVILGLALGPGAAVDAAAQPSAGAVQEIDHMLSYVAGSGCGFFRNGSWYDAQRALDHLRTKYDYLRSGITSSEEFIERAATKSSLSGQPYLVRCGAGTPVASGTWLMDELARYRHASAHATAAN